MKYDNKTGLPVEPFVLEDLAHDLTDQLLAQQRNHRRQNAGRIATGARHESRAANRVAINFRQTIDRLRQQIRRAVLVAAGVLLSIAALVPWPKVPRLPLSLAVVTLGAFASAFLAHTHNYPGRMSIHLVPFAVAFSGLPVGAFISILVFLLLLIEGLVWAWGKGCLNWEK